MKILCRSCEQMTEIPERVGFHQGCPSCGAWLHSCVQCRFWSVSGCREPSAEKPRDPEGQNFCEWYNGIDADSAREKPKGGGKEAAEEMWKKLMKK